MAFRATIERAANGYAVVIEHDDKEATPNHLSVHGLLDDAVNFVSEFFTDVEGNEGKEESKDGEAEVLTEAEAPVQS
mgnify:CR=1 FL=1|jgi:hypothetical protein